MIWPLDAAKLAYTKLRTRKIRLVVTVVTSSLLFGLLMGASFVVRGVVANVETLSETGFGNRFILTGYPVVNSFDGAYNPDLIIEAEALQKATQARKVIEAKRLGVDYDPKTDQKLVDEYDTPAGKQKTLNVTQPEVQNIVSKYTAALPGNDADFEKLADRVGASRTYRQVMANGMYGQMNFSVLKEGKENYKENQNQAQPGPPTGVDGITAQWQLISKELMAPFLLKGQTVVAGADGSLPTVAPFSAAEELVGLKPLPATASTKAKLDRLTEVRTKAGGYTFSVCYRNSTSRATINETVQQKEAIELGKSDKNYVKPTLIYELPDQPCGPTKVTRDVRTADEKKHSANEQEFRRIFGEPAPESKLLTLRIVGINADADFSSSISVTQVLQGIVVSTIGTGWFSPLETAQNNEVASKIFGLDNAALASTTYFMELNSAAQAKKVISEETCEPDYGMGMNGSSGADPAKVCRDSGKYFGLAPFGSSSIAMDDLKNGFAKVFTIAAAAVAIIAAIIMMSTVGRIIADSRRETAVFRAIGAKRSDISQIYLTYTFMVAACIIFTSIIGGLIIASIIQARYSHELQISTALAFNVTDVNTTFSMISVYPRDVAIVVGLIVVASLVAAMLPIMTNVRRNPISDMRDER